jgi:large repetitive protein
MLRLLLAATLGALVSLGTGSALAVHVQCGDVITADTRLDADLHCPAEGLVIGAADVTVDLGGHLISAETIFSKGIDNSAGHDRVTITNGTIRGWDAIVADGASEMTVRETLVAAVRFGIAYAHAAGGTIEHNTVTAPGGGGILEGIRVVASRDVWVMGNAVDKVNTGIGVGISSFGSHVEDNTVTRTTHQGIVLGPGGNHVVRNNVVTGDGRYGVDLVLSSDNLVEKNFVAGHQSFGLAVEFHSDRNLIRKNTMLGSDLFGMFVTLSADNLIDKNEAREGRLDGIQVFDASGPNTFRRNEASGNGRDGIRVLPADQTLVTNTANSNGDLGIEADPGTIDGGGNRARDNGNAAQCVGVACK